MGITLVLNLQGFLWWRNQKSSPTSHIVRLLFVLTSGIVSTPFNTIGRNRVHTSILYKAYSTNRNSNGARVMVCAVVSACVDLLKATKDLAKRRAECYISPYSFCVHRHNSLIHPSGKTHISHLHPIIDISEHHDGQCVLICACVPNSIGLLLY